MIWRVYVYGVLPAAQSEPVEVEAENADAAREIAHTQLAYRHGIWQVDGLREPEPVGDPVQ